ncbi:unnamed protein product [Prunus armeniaca]|uniref:Uncharacterized protein n=1 Tax=Prunus armeniaca TaxID=36596 RepID=A0A6J5TJ90_PRUAR|nr:unnamed protein product [Prunus armeniaca]
MEGEERAEEGGGRRSWPERAERGRRTRERWEMRLEKQMQPPCLIRRKSVDLWLCEHVVGDNSKLLLLHFHGSLGRSSCDSEYILRARIVFEFWRHRIQEGKGSR